MLRRLSAVACLLGVVMLSGVASADVWHSLNFDGAAQAVNNNAAPGAFSNVGTGGTQVARWEVAAFSYVGFQDIGGGNVGTLGAGDKFTDYVALTVRTFNGPMPISANLTPVGYGNGPGSTHELTVIAVLNGTQVDATSYTIDSISQLNFIFDAGANFTPSDFSNISTFDVDPTPVTGTGTLVESAGPLLLGGGTNANNVSPNGSITLVWGLVDQLANGNFEYNLTDPVTGNPVVLGPQDWLVGTATINNSIPIDSLTMVPINTQSVANAFGTYFSFLPGTFGTGTPPASYGGGTFDFGFVTESNGQFRKDVLRAPNEVPEPASMLVWGVGMGIAGVMGLRRRRNKAKA